MTKQLDDGANFLQSISRVVKQNFSTNADGIMELNKLASAILSFMVCWLAHARCEVF